MSSAVVSRGSGRRRVGTGRHAGDPNDAASTRVRRAIAEDPAVADRAHIRQALQRDVAEHAGLLGYREGHRQELDLIAALRGTGAHLRELWEDASVTDVRVNAADSVWSDRGNGLERQRGVRVGDVRLLATTLAASAGQRLDDASPIVDGRLPDGTRLHAVLAPVAADGACISLRRHRAQAISLADWQQSGGVGQQGLVVLTALVEKRANVLISGSTGSGKTTLLAAMLGHAPPTERIVVIEEAQELAPAHPHVVHLQARAANVQGAGGVDLASLVRAAMRMRPDRLVLGECRGAEVREVLTALNTGHDGGLATVHANAATDVPARLIALGSLAGLTAPTVAVQAVSAFDAVVHVARVGGRRMVTQVAVLGLAQSGALTAEIALQIRGSEMKAGLGWEQLAAQLGLRPDADTARPLSRTPAGVP